ncbi:MAG: F0F1 ATP synthase subunit gamma [Henriciella sp.]|nr:F0F1 ATP synthase subunit gamma [Henriciella sp.]
MEKIERLHRAVATVTDIRSIIRTMTSLSIVSLKHLSEAMVSLREVQLLNSEALGATLRQSSRADFDMSSTADGEGCIVIGTERGLCGQLNQVLLDALAQRPDDPSHPVLIVGTRLYDELDDVRRQNTETIELAATADRLSVVVDHCQDTIEAWLRTGISQVKTLFLATSTRGQVAVTSQSLWPVSPAEIERLTAVPWPTRKPPAVFVDHQGALGALFRMKLRHDLFAACLATMLSEHGSRVSNLKLAERNIDDRLRDLNLQINRERQSAITAELRDIMSGRKSDRRAN